MPSVLITGANRGIGFEFAKQYAGAGWRVYAGCREPGKANELDALAKSTNKRVSIHRLDVEDLSGIDNLARELKDAAIDVLMNNAGIYNDRGLKFGNTDYVAWAEAFRINTMATLKMAEAFVEHVARSEKKIIVTIASKMGSMADNTSGGSYLYRTSKAAVNAVVKSLSMDLKSRGIIAVVLNPGWVQTDMGGKQAPLTVEQSIAALRKIISKLTINDSGKFYHYDGTEILW